MLHPQFFLFLSISLRKGAFLLGRKSVPFWVKVRSFSKDRPYLLREKSAPFLWRARSSSLELLSHKYMQLVLMNNPTGLKSPPLRSPPLNSRLSSIIQFRSIFSCDKFYMLRCLFEALYVDMRCFGVSWVFSKHDPPPPKPMGKYEKPQKYFHNRMLCRYFHVYSIQIR